MLAAMDSGIVGEDFLDFKCPHCGTLNSFPTSAARLVRECVNCLDLLIVPAKDGEEARTLPTTVEGQQIRLRFLEPRDWRDLLEFQFEDEDEATGWIPKSGTARTEETRLPFHLAVEIKETHKVAGTLEFRFLDISFNQVEISLTANKGIDLPGLELEAFEAALDYGFQELNLHRVITECSPEDSESCELFKHLGMRQEAEFRKHYLVGTEWKSTAYFAILEEEYFKEGSEKTATDS
jgi:RimJ/RimL family protein N-acetyltransferase